MMTENQKSPSVRHPVTVNNRRNAHIKPTRYVGVTTTEERKISKFVTVLTAWLVFALAPPCFSASTTFCHIPFVTQFQQPQRYSSGVTTVTLSPRILYVYIQLTYTTISRTPHLDNNCVMQHCIINQRKVILTDTVNRIQNTEYIHLTSPNATPDYETSFTPTQQMSRPVSWSILTLSLLPIFPHTDDSRIHTGILPHTTHKSLQHVIPLSSTPFTFVSQVYSLLYHFSLWNPFHTYVKHSTYTVLLSIPTKDIITIRSPVNLFQSLESYPCPKLDVMHVTSNFCASYGIDNICTTGRFSDLVAVTVVTRIENIPYISHRKHIGHTTTLTSGCKVTPIYIASGDSRTPDIHLKVRNFSFAEVELSTYNQYYEMTLYSRDGEILRNGISEKVEWSYI